MFNPITTTIKKPITAIRNRFSQTDYVAIGFYGFDEEDVGRPAYDREDIPRGQISQLRVAGRPFDYYGQYVEGKLERQLIFVPHLVEISIHDPPSMIRVIQSSPLAVTSDGKVYKNPEYSDAEIYFEPLAKLLFDGAKENLSNL
ncbi:MAG: hypothetical protein J4452_04085 [Candidatus Aenigmarchaeota archaeon]|nr:hypothetical protein [Candidatus Aenigmarchaeota archaeon]